MVRDETHRSRLHVNRMDINKIVAESQQSQIERDVRASRIAANAALLSAQRTDKKLENLSLDRLSLGAILAKAQGAAPEEVTALKTQIRSLEARLAKLEDGQKRHTTRLDKHLTRSKAHGARLGHLESKVLPAMAKAAQAREEILLAKGEKRLEQAACLLQRDAILAKASGVMDTRGIAKVEIYLNGGQLKEALAAVNEAETTARETEEFKAQAAAQRRW